MENTKNLFKSLAAFQQEVPVIHKGTTGYGYSYANLTAIFGVINPLMKKHKLGFTQLLNGTSIKTVVFCVTSGESISSEVEIPQEVVLKQMNQFQVIGSAITYYRRYALSAALGLVTDKDIDACGEQEKSIPSQTATPTQKTPSEATAKKEAPVKDTNPLTDKHPKWEAAKKALASGQVTMEKIKENYMISAKFEKLLIAK